MKKIKLYLLRRLYLWWTNYDKGCQLRGTKIDKKITELLK